MVRKKTFTLIELLVVISIIILLIGIALLVFSKGDYQKKQNDSQRKKDIQELSNAIEEFKADHGHYPLINWGPGIHAYQITGYAGHNECIGTFDYNYTAYNDKYNGQTIGGKTYEFDPGTEIKFTSDTNEPCDDLSLQLLGKAYLRRMPNDNPDTSPDVGGVPTGYDPTNEPGPNGLWDISGASLKKYIDEIPKDPVFGKNVGLSCNTESKYNSDYNTVTACQQVYRYLYISYYSCVAENINVGDRYWINAIVQIQGNGEYDDPADPDTPGGTGAYFYEWGTANWFRHPRSLCPK